jgi:GH35 family endo-1,4-beta-xylanase
MKKIIFVITGLVMFVFASCYDEKMQWDDPYTHPAASELPLQLQEQIARYQALNTYTNFKLGVGIDFNLYQTDEKYRNLINENFSEITPGNELKNSSIVSATGVLNFAKADATIADLKAAGLSIYGHTLVWHSQQNASYYNTLIAPTILPGPAGSSLIDGDFENGLAGFAPPYYADAVTASTEEHLSGEHSLKVAVGAWGSGKYDMQVNSPTFPIINGHHYEISFFIKSNVPGSVGLDFPNNNLGNQYPWSDGAELTPTSGAWKQVVYNTEKSGGTAMIATADNSAMTFRFLLGSTANCTYYIDNIVVLDLDAAPAEVNFVENGDFETGDLTSWKAVNPGAGVTVTADAKFAGSYGLQGISSATSSNEWNLQIQSNNIILDAAKTYTMSFWIKSDIEGKGRISFVGFSDEYPWLNWDGSGSAALFNTNSSWTQLSFDITPVYKDGASDVKISFDLGKLPGVTYFVDDVKIVEKPAASATRRKVPIIIEKTPEEKATILETALHNFVQGMVEHFAGDVAAWDAVNEPLNENGTLRSGEENLNATNVFYWQYYLGRDYAVKVFKWAKQYAPASTKFFINDYNLESDNGAKLDGMIAYVQYIESQGATVDGIGTQMHLNVNRIDTASIKTMFQKLAATGKLIKVSELDIAISQESSPANPVQPTAEQYARQAELYRAVAELYTRYIPENQRYGITVWGVTDNEKEHEYWLKNDTPCLWNADYARKHAYKGFANGLAGRDVSVDFTGELQW